VIGLSPGISASGASEVSRHRSFIGISARFELIAAACLKASRSLRSGSFPNACQGAPRADIPIDEMIAHGYAADGADAARKAVLAGVDMEMVARTISTICDRRSNAACSIRNVSTMGCATFCA
jgi:hypothetical protein